MTGPVILYYVASGFKFPSMKHYVRVEIGEQVKVLDTERVMFRPINSPQSFNGFVVFPGKDAFTDKESAKKAAVAMRGKFEVRKSSGTMTLNTENNMAKRIKKLEGETKLQRVARVWMNNTGRDYQNGWIGAYKDLEHGGCESGMVGKLIYYTDTVKFYRRHKDEINANLRDALADSGFTSPAEVFGEKWDAEDPLANDTHNQNLLAWFGFETAARQIADANGYEG